MSLINDALKRASEAQKQRPNDGPRLSSTLQPVERLKRPSNLPLILLPLAFSVVLVVAGALLFLWWQKRGDQRVSREPSVQPVQVAAPMAATAPPAIPITPPPAVAQLPPPANTPPVIKPSPAKPVANPNQVAQAQPAPKPEAAPTTVIKTTAPAKSPVKPTVVPMAAIKPPISPPPPPETKTPDPAPPAPITRPPVKPVEVAIPAPVAPTAPPPVKPVEVAVTTPVVAPAPPTPQPAPQPAPAPPPVKVTFPTLALNGIFFRVTNPSAVINGKTVFMGDLIGDEPNEVKVIKITRDSVTVELGSESKVLKLR